MLGVQYFIVHATNYYSSFSHYCANLAEGIHPLFMVATLTIISRNVNSPMVHENTQKGQVWLLKAFDYIFTKLNRTFSNCIN